MLVSATAGILSTLYSRIRYFLLSLPVRIWRLIRHVFFIFSLIFDRPEQLPVHYTYRNRFLVWTLELFHYVVDLAALPEILELVHQVMHPKNKPLPADLKNSIRTVYGTSVNTDMIRVDHYQRYMIDKAHAFVGFHTVFFNRKVSESLLIHEVCHCLQYQVYGSVYIIRSLLAQNSDAGYDYGGYLFLKGWIDHGDINQLNYEQMAEIFSHYYVLCSEDSFRDPEREAVIRVYRSAVERILFQIGSQDSISSALRLWI